MLKRQKQVTVRFTEEEYHQLKNKCDAAGMKMEPFLRALVSGCTIRERPPDSYKALAAQVAAVGNNLNQLTRLANSTGKIENAQLAEASRIMQRIWQFMQEKSYYKDFARSWATKRLLRLCCQSAKDRIFQYGRYAAVNRLHTEQG